MAGHFRGVLIFMIFVVDLAVTKFPPIKMNSYSDTRVDLIIDEGCGQKPYADGGFDINILLSQSSDLIESDLQ